MAKELTYKDVWDTLSKVDGTTPFKKIRKTKTN